MLIFETDNEMIRQRVLDATTADMILPDAAAVS